MAHLLPGVRELILVDFDSSNLIPEVKRTDRAAACFARLLSICKCWHHMYYPVVLCILRDRRSRAMFAAGYRASASRSLKGLGLTQHWTVRFGPLFFVVLVVFAAAAAFFCGGTKETSAFKHGWRNRRHRSASDWCVLQVPAGPLLESAAAGSLPVLPSTLSSSFALRYPAFGSSAFPFFPRLTKC